MIVQKYGGSSVADAVRVRRVAVRIAKACDAGLKPVVVLSAQGDTTDDLIKKAHELNEAPSRREMDVLLSTGEQVSIALMAMTLQGMGYPCVSLTGMQAGISTSDEHRNARVRKIDTQRIYRELERNNIVLVAGFQGMGSLGDITTLGRGGSDTTAVALAAALGAKACEIYTDVDGVFTADPRVVHGARKLDEVSYDEMLELASLGAKVLHHRSVELAKKYNVNLKVLSSMEEGTGTSVREVARVEHVMISGLALDRDTARIAVIGIKDAPGMAFRVFSLLSRQGISVDVIAQSSGSMGKKDISFTVERTDLREAMKLLEGNKDHLCCEHISIDEDVCKLSIVGAGMVTTPGIATMMFEALYDADIRIDTITTSEIKISVLINSKDAERAANAVHDKFFGDKAKV